MKTLNKDLTQKIQVWIAPLPPQTQDLIWEALRATQQAGVPFNAHANDFSELLMWHLSPVGNFFWESIHQVTQHLWEVELSQLGKKVVPAPHRMREYCLADVAA